MLGHLRSRNINVQHQRVREVFFQTDPAGSDLRWFNTITRRVTARKIGFTLKLILIKVEVKYDHSFDPNFDARQMCVKNVMALPIHLIHDKEEGKCDLNFDSTFDPRKRGNQISYGFAIHLIPAKGEVKHVNNFDYSFDAR